MSPPRKKATRRAGSSKKTSTRKQTARKPTGKAARKPAARKKPVARRAAAKKPVKRTSARKASARKASGRKAAGKKSVKRTVTKAPAKRTASRKSAGGKAAAAGATARKTPIRKLPQRPKSRPARPAKFDKQDLARIRTQLESERADLQGQLAELEEDSFEGTQSDLTGEVGLDEDFADAGTATFDRERDLSIRNNIRDLIGQITRAIRKLDEGTYGTCESCGNPIDAARIRALPHALLCLDCKRREERTR